jgi:hypothetical protein
MVKCSRVDPCPCGSGKKCKNCHPHLPRSDNVAGFYNNQEIKKFVLITKDLLTNCIYRDSPAIARSFDQIARKDIEAISSIYGEVTYMISRHLIGVDLDDLALKPTCARLLLSASQTFAASIQIARYGFRRQYGNMARSVGC